MTEKEYLEKRKFRDDYVTVFGHKTVTLEELNASIDHAIKSVGDNASDIFFYINGDDDYNGSLRMSFKRLETKEETERRLFNKKMVHDSAIKSLERLIEINPKEAVEIIKNKGLI